MHDRSEAEITVYEYSTEKLSILRGLHTFLIGMKVFIGLLMVPLNCSIFGVGVIKQQRTVIYFQSSQSQIYR